MRPGAASVLLHVILASVLLRLSSPKSAATCRKSSKSSPEEYVTWGAEAYEKNDLENAEKCFRLASTAKPLSAYVGAVALTNLATVLTMKGDAAGADTAYADAAKVAPSDAEVFWLWGKFLVDSASDAVKREEGRRHLQKSLSLNPTHAPSHVQLGVEHQKDGQYDQAVQHFARAIQADPTHTTARVQEVIVLALSNKCKKATRKARDILPTPKLGEKLLGGLAYVFETCGENALWKTTLARAMEESPEGVMQLGEKRSYLFKYATALVKEQRYLEAIAHFRKALQIDLQPATVHNYLGYCYTELGGRYFNKALHEFHRAAVAFKLLRDDGSRGAGPEHLEGGRSLEEASGALANLVRLKYVTANWTGIDDHMAVLGDLIELSLRNNFRAPVNPVFILAYPVSDSIVTRVAMSYGLSTNPHALDPTKLASFPWIADAPDTASRIRVGFLSSAFSDNGVGKHLEKWKFWAMCAAHAGIECFVLSTGPHTQGGGTTPLLSALKTLVGEKKVIELPRDAGSKANAEAIRSLRLHILLDLNGYTEGEQPELVRAQGRSAPLQALFYGYEGTYGDATAFDYLLTDTTTGVPELTGTLPRLVPETAEGGSEKGEIGSGRSDKGAVETRGGAGSGMYSEKLLLLPRCKFPSGDLMKEDEEEVEKEDVEEFRRNVLGAVPGEVAKGPGEETFVFCNFAKYFKMLPEVFESWVRILLRVPNSVLWMLAYRKDGAAEAIPHLRQVAARMGLDPARIVVTPLLDRERHIQIKSLAHLVLDTSPYNGHLTAAEALWAGLPVLTLPQARLSSRVSSAMLRSLGLHSLLVSRSLQDYEDLAVTLAQSWRRAGRSGGERKKQGKKKKGDGNVGSYDEIVEHIRERRAQRRGFFDTAYWTQAFASAVRVAWDVHVLTSASLDRDPSSPAPKQSSPPRFHIIVADHGDARSER